MKKTTFLRSILMVISVSLAITNVEGSVWLYDFGTTTGNVTTASNTITFFSSTPTNGGTYRIRIGSGGGSLVLANPGTTLGSDSEVQLTAATGTSTNKFGVYDWTAPSSVASMKFKLRTTSAGTGNLNVNLGINTLVTDNNGFTNQYNNSIASLTITYTTGVISGVTRRASGSTTAITSHGFLKDVDQLVEIYANNGTASTAYDKSGSNTLPTKTWDLWVDGVKVVSNSATAGTLAAGTNLSGFALFAESSASNSAVMYIDDLEYSNAFAVGSSTPTLSADATNNNVDNNIDITFADDATWRAAVTAVKIGTTTLTSGTDYVLSSGLLQLKPSGGNSALTASGDKTLSIVATGYSDATLNQTIGAGAPTANSTATIDVSLTPNISRTITCTAKDQYNNLVSGYTFKYDATVTNNNPTTTESYAIDGVSKTATVTDVALTTATNASGVATFTVAVPFIVDGNDGVSIQVQQNNGATNVSSAFVYIQLASQTITFNPLATVTYGVADIDLTAVATSSLPVSYTSSNTSVAKILGNKISIVGAGSTDITASQAGNGTYNAALSVVQSLNVSAKHLTCADAVAQNKTYTGTEAAIIVGSLSGVINSDDVTLVGTGTFASANVANGIAVTSTSTLTGAKALNYILDQPAGLTANITKADQTIEFASLPNRIVGSANLTLTATSNSGLSVTFESSNTNVATVLGTSVTIVGAGSADIIATQTGNGNYNLATKIQPLRVLSAQPSGDVIITEVFGGGGNSGAVYKNDFVELFNTTASTVDLSGWALTYYSSTGTGLASNIFEIPAGSSIAPYRYFLIQASAGAGGTTDLPTPDAVSTLNLSGSAGKIILNLTKEAQTISDLASITGNQFFKDYVPYGAAAAPVWGTSTTDASSTTSASRKKVSGSYSYTSNIGTDFELIAPNPQNSGSTVRLNRINSILNISVVNGVIKIMGAAGESIEIYNSVGEKLVQKQAVEGLNSIPVVARGVMLVKVGNRTAKVVL